MTRRSFFKGLFAGIASLLVFGTKGKSLPLDRPESNGLTVEKVRQCRDIFEAHKQSGTEFVCQLPEGWQNWNKKLKLKFDARESFTTTTGGDIANLYQLHWQFENGTTDIWAQSEINSVAEMKAWEQETVENHPLPKGAQWLLCNHKSKYFVWAAEP